ncbi:unnamed protein product, partial [Rotaria sp. Silwood2]
MIAQYKQAVGSEIIWPAFTSTTKDRRVAEEQFDGNALFIISVKDSWQTDISSLSHYPDEQEVLLNYIYQFKVEKVDQDPISGQYLINLKL